jgi:hypothetical protein
MPTQRIYSAILTAIENKVGFSESGGKIEAAINDTIQDVEDTVKGKITEWSENYTLVSGIPSITYSSFTVEPKWITYCHDETNDYEVYGKGREFIKTRDYDDPDNGNPTSWGVENETIYMWPVPGNDAAGDELLFFGTKKLDYYVAASTPVLPDRLLIEGACMFLYNELGWVEKFTQARVLYDMEKAKLRNTLFHERRGKVKSNW